MLIVPFGKKTATSMTRSYDDSTSVHVFKLVKRKLAHFKVTHVLNFHLFLLWQETEVFFFS